MKNRQKVGLDKWKVQMDTSEFLKLSKQYGLELYDITLHYPFIHWYASCMQRALVYRAFQHCELLTTTGLLGYLLRSLKKPTRILAMLLSICLWYGLSQMIYAIDIKGEKKESRLQIETTLRQMGYIPPFYGQNVQDLKQKLKKKLENEIAWLEITKEGSRYVIHYTPKVFATIEPLKQDELIAKEDGMIARFDIQHGFKERKVNDFVHKGDVLVKNILADSKGKTEEVYVKGRVFAYTWKDVQVSMDANTLPKAFHFYELLLQARSEISKEFKKDDTIYNENILQFYTDMGKIRMVIHYTLMKDITTP